MLKKKLAAIVSGCPPARAIDSFVISVSMASIGVGMRLTVKIGGDAGERRRQPDQRVPPHAQERGGASGMRIR